MSLEEEVSVKVVKVSPKSEVVIKRICSIIVYEGSERIGKWLCDDNQDCKMKILILTTSYPRNASDMSGIFIKRLAKAMARFGATITVLAPGDAYAEARELENGINVVRFAYAPRPLMRIAYGSGGIPENLRRRPWLIVIVPFFIISLIIHAILLARNCDVIHANWLATGLFGLPAKKIRKKQMVVTLRGSDFKKSASKLSTFVAKRVDAITTVNQKWAEDLSQRLGQQTFYIPNGVEIRRKAAHLRKRFNIDYDEIVVLYVGVLCLRKGADLLAKTARIMTEMDGSVRFLVIGPGDPEKFNLDKLPNVTYVGGLPPDEVLSLYGCSDIFVLPSRHEGRPNVLLEAMASGLPSVATRLPGVIEVLTDESGIIVDAEDERGLSRAIYILAKDPHKRKRLGARARARIAELSLDWDTSAKKYLQVFQEVVSCVG